MGSTRIVFSAQQAAAALWTYGEDGCSQSALQLTADDLRLLWTAAGSRWREDHGLPLQGRLILDKVTALVCIEHFEGCLRPLARERRRPRKAMPEQLRLARPVSPDIDMTT